MTLTLQAGFASLNDLWRVKRYYVRPELFWTQQFLDNLKHDFRDRTPIRAAQLDLDLIVNPRSYAESDHNLGLLIERLLKLGVNTVFLQAYCDKEGNGNIKSLYFPNRVLPVEMDFLSHAVNRIKAREIKVFVWMPALSFQLPPKMGRENLYVQEYKHGRLGRTTSWYKRLSPAAPGSLEIARQNFQDLDDYLQHYDYTVIMAYTKMEGVKGWRSQKRWFDTLLQAVLGRGAREKVIFKIQTYDWKNHQWMPVDKINRQLAYLLAHGARHVAYYPDDVFANQPPRASFAPIISGQDEVLKIKIPPG
ncbi:MAG: poly-beta-1,6-N-acetyl-D-glucosamine N-deacetylase PgaB [Deltaproteobacteria bacterium]